MSGHPLAVKGAASEKRWAQPSGAAAQLFAPLPTSIAMISITTGGKTSQMLHVTNLLFHLFDRIVIAMPLCYNCIKFYFSRFASPATKIIQNGQAKNFNRRGSELELGSPSPEWGIGGVFMLVCALHVRGLKASADFKWPKAPEDSSNCDGFWTEFIALI